jgi:hypothetical protein
MPPYIKGLIFFSWLTIYNETLYGQTTESNPVSDTTYTLIGDTLFTNKTFKLYVGQQLLSGGGSSENGWYQSITFKSGSSWPVLLWDKTETKNNLDYQLDPQLRVNDKLKEYLNKGDILTVKKIIRNGNKRYGYWYIAILQTTDFPSIKFRAWVADAFIKQELILSK